MTAPIAHLPGIRSRRRDYATLALLATGALGVFAVALATGSVAVPARSIVEALAGVTGDSATIIVRELRLPRALAGFATGGLLALAGALMQVLLRNPLADPYVLGISGGAAAGALLAIIAGVSALASPAAFIGAIASTLVVFGLARAPDRDAPWNPTRLLLTGVVVAAGWGALIALMLTLAPESQVKGMLFWLIGDLSSTVHAAPAGVALALALAASLAIARELNVLARGAEFATSVGVASGAIALAAGAIAALATAVAVTTAGTIGFVGLVVPHALRLVLGNDQRVLLPACAIAGGTLVVAADTLARSVAAPMQFPVGVLTALLGVPVFLALLARRPDLRRIAP